MLECVSNLAANEMFKEGTGKEEGTQKEGTGKRKQESRGGPIQRLSHKIAEDIISLAGQVQDMVIVTNEVDRDGICYEPETMEYIRLMGCPESEAGICCWTGWWRWFMGFPCS